VSDFFSPSGFMGDGAYFGNLTGTTNSGCKPRPPGARGNCYAFTYYPNIINSDPWAGVFWVFPSNSWGSTRGHAIDIKRFKQISFWGAVEAPTPYTVNGASQQFQGQAGGIDPIGFYNGKDPTGKAMDYVDGVKTFGAWQLGTPAVTSDLQHYSFPLSDLDKGIGCKLGQPDANGNPTPSPNCDGDVVNGMGFAKYVIGAFAWALHYPTDSVACKDGTDSCHMDNTHSSQFVNPKPVRVYIDDIVWSTDEYVPPTP
jgi:hypothetical protein